MPKSTVMAVAEPISPELVLVSPDLRERALVALPAVDAEALFVVAPRAAQLAPAPEQETAPDPHAVPELAPRYPFAVAFLSYVGEAVLLGALRGAAMVAAVAVVAFVLAR